LIRSRTKTVGGKGKVGDLAAAAPSQGMLLRPTTDK
jgi:hypothetical protein